MTFQYYAGGNITARVNGMSTELYKIFMATALDIGRKVHFVHAGVLPSNQHLINNPDSWHNSGDAIDIVKVYADGELWADCRRSNGKHRLADVISRYGGFVRHLNQENVKHLHVQAYPESR